MYFVFYNVFEFLNVYVLIIMFILFADVGPGP